MAEIITDEPRKSTDFSWWAKWDDNHRNTTLVAKINTPVIKNRKERRRERKLLKDSPKRSTNRNG